MIDFKVNPINKFQEDILASRYRHICASGGYGNGKTTIACYKLQLLAAMFSNYRVGIFRHSSIDLQHTTRVSFYNVCPPQLYSEELGGSRADSRNMCQFYNGSQFIWMHLKDVDLNVIKGLELNAAFIDQAEEVSEELYDHLDARVGRWSGAKVPSHLDSSLFEINPATGELIPPSYMIIAVNPASKLHWVFRRYHPESPFYKEVRKDDDGNEYTWSDDHIMFEAASDDNPALSKQTIDIYKRKSKEWRNTYFHGKWGGSGAQIHEIDPLSILENPPPEFYADMIKHGTLYRIYDHGHDYSPSCCLWLAYYKEWLIFYREYYKGNVITSEHRQNIFRMSVSTLSAGHPLHEQYAKDIADPSIFKKTMEKYGGFWTVAMEFRDQLTSSEGEVPPIFWSAADNSEYVSRSKINELLSPNPEICHPLDDSIKQAPKIYFIKRSKQYPSACYHAILETEAQERIKLGTLNGEEVYSDDRNPKIPDHAYDCVRYAATSRLFHAAVMNKIPSENSFFGRLNDIKRRRGSKRNQLFIGV